jgi:putative membrane protein
VTGLKGSVGIFLRGLAMGAADIVPGVSGGTIALITGIYERLVESISKLRWSHLTNQDREEKVSLIQRVDIGLFIPLGLGIVLAIFLMSNIIAHLLDRHSSPTYAFFFILIMSSALVLMRERGLITYLNILFLAIGFVVTFLLVESGVMDLDHSLPMIFVSGAIAICAMILPGISGALILLFLGQYEFMLDALRGLEWEKIFTFGLGAIIGLLAFSRVLNYLIKNYKTQTLSFLIGLMLGALRLPYQKITIDSNTIFPIWVAALVGFSLIFVLEMGYARARHIKQKDSGESI